MSALLPKFESDWPTGRRFSTIAFITWFVLFSFICYRFIGGYLFLFYTYGFSRVVREHLYFVKMSKFDPWIVSNGDKIPGGGFLWWLMVTVIFFALFVLTFHFIYSFLPKRKEKDAA